ncbi:MAG TPA: extracellular solute-binding protein [Spirochaetia bacterium]
MKKLLAAAFLITLLAGPAHTEQIRFLYMKQSGYDLGDVVAWADAFSRQTGIRVSPIFVEYEDRYNLIVQTAARSVPDLDLILVDLIWVADFAEKGIIDPLPPAVDRQVRDGIVPKIWSAFSWRQKLWALPFHVDLQMLYTNGDDLAAIGETAPPRTLEDLVRMARKARAKGVVKYPIFDSWKQQEVLTCELTWLVGAFGGSLVGPDGRIDCTSPAARRALGFMVDLLSEGLANPYSLESDENFVSEVFLAGDCMFTTNWNFMIRLLAANDQPGVRRWSVSPIPVSAEVSPDGRGTSSICGFEGLSVLRGSRHKEAAWRFARSLASADFQGRHLEFMPVWKEVWDREESRKLDPFLSVKELEITGLQYRPVHPRYRQISAVLQHWIAQALRKQVPVAEALAAAQAQVDRIVGSSP